MSNSKNNDYTTGNLLDCEYFSEHYKLIAMDLSEQTELENPDFLRQQINFIGKLEDDKATMFFIIEKSEETTFEFLQNSVSYKMETQKIINLLNDSSNEESKFATKKYGMSQTVKQQKGKYKQHVTIKFETENIKSSLCDYSDTFILVAGNNTVNADNNTDVAFKKCASFSTCITKINDVFVDKTNHISIAMPMYNLIEYSNNYSDTSGSLWQFKRDKVLVNNVDLTIDNSQSFKYKAALLGKTADNDGESFVKDAKIVVPLKYLSNFWRSLEMPLINCKVYLELINCLVAEILQNLQ